MMLAHDMGLGKTIQAAAIVAIDQPKYTLYLTKKTIVSETAKELNLWFRTAPGFVGMALPILSRPNQSKDTVKMTLDMARAMPGNVVIVTNYESLQTFDYFNAVSWDLLIVDEVHKLKGGADYNPTKVWKNTKDLVWEDSVDGVIPKELIKELKNHPRSKLKPNVDRFLFLTGTPINNHPGELFAYLNIFNPVVFDDRRVIADTFEMIRSGALDFKTADIIKMLTPMMHRMTKADVAENLPELNYQTHEVLLSTNKKGALQSQDEAYRAARDDAILALSQEVGDEIPMSHALQILTRCRQILVQAEGLTITKKVIVPDGTQDGKRIDVTTRINWLDNAKINKAIELTDSLLFEGENVVIFTASFNEPLYFLKKYYNELGVFRAEIIDGGNKDVTSTMDAWKAGDINILLVNMAAGAEGLNCQKSDKWVGGASHAILLDLWYNPQRNAQAAARLHRLDTRLPVFIHSFHAYDSDGGPTADAFIQAMCDNKMWWHDNVTDNEEFRTKTIKKSDLLKLI
jgi:SNF2 family DNA or RNA helicase